jgi:hypothetical protein
VHFKTNSCHSTATLRTSNSIRITVISFIVWSVGKKSISRIPMYNKTYHSMTQFQTATLRPEKSDMSEVSRYVSITSNWDFALKVADFVACCMTMSIHEEKSHKRSPCNRPWSQWRWGDVQLYSHATSTLETSGQFTSRPGRFTPRERDALSVGRRPWSSSRVSYTFSATK